MNSVSPNLIYKCKILLGSWMLISVSFSWKLGMSSSSCKTELCNVVIDRIICNCHLIKFTKNTVYQIIEKKAWILTTLSSFGKTSNEAEQGEKKERETRMSLTLIKWCQGNTYISSVLKHRKHMLDARTERTLLSFRFQTSPKFKVVFGVRHPDKDLQS